MKRTAELREKRAKLIADARAMLDKASTEKRDLTSEDQANYDKFLNEADSLKTQIEREERLAEAEREAAGGEIRTDPTSGFDLTKRPDHFRALARRPGSSEYLELRKMAVTESAEFHTRAALPGTVEHELVRNAMRRYLITPDREMSPDEWRDLSAGASIQGGYLVPPEDYQREIIKKVDDYVFIRQLATKYLVTQAQDMGVPTLDANPDDADWTTELATGNADTAMVFGKRAFVPKPLAKRLLVSNKLIRQSVFDVDAFVRDRLGYKFGISHEKGFLTGTGTNQPLGLFTPSSQGISTTRDISTGNTTTALTFDGLMEAFYGLKVQYQTRASWGFSRTAVKNISKLKDGDGQYLWRVSVREGQPDTILNRPFFMSEYVPNVFTTGAYVGIVGDMSFYWIVDALNLQFQRLIELYAATNQIGYIGRLETDGMPVLEEAFTRVKLA